MPADRSDAMRARIALQRFGLGPRPGALRSVIDNPRAALRRELDRPELALINDATLPSASVAARISQEGYVNADALRLLELRARTRKHLAAEVGFLERLVLFWSNHFSMSSLKNDAIRGTYGQLERDVIRRNLLGKFGDMLQGVMHHPAMICYLDNQDSVGPNSEYGRRTGRGFNENLARELLELHTLGSGGGYSEKDVTNFAKILTGWSYVRGYEADAGINGGNPGNRGQFIFRADWHEPGAIEFMGKRYGAGGLSQGEEALGDLVRRRATAQHIAFKLVRHFITDDPTPKMVEPVAEAFHGSRGDLKETVLALISLPEAWRDDDRKLRTPYELGIAQLRGLQTDYSATTSWAIFEPMRAMHHLPWERPAPDGYSDENFTWLDPDGLTVRLDAAMLCAQVFGGATTMSAGDLADALYGRALTGRTASALGEQRDARVVGLTLLFMSPEFQRR